MIFAAVEVLTVALFFAAALMTGYVLGVRSVRLPYRFTWRCSDCGVAYPVRTNTIDGITTAEVAAASVHRCNS